MNFKELVEMMVSDIQDSYASPMDDPGEPPGNIVDRYEPLLQETVAIDKYINQSANEIMDEYPEDGTIQDKVDFFIGLKERKKLVESKLASINNVIQQIQPELIAWVESNPTTTVVGSNGKKASIRTSMYPKVRDLKSLKKALADSWSQFEGVNVRELGNLIRGLRDRAKKDGVDIHDLLPPGLDVSITKSLTVSAGSSNRVRERQDGLDDLLDLITGKGETE
jgi:hypothetical protein